MRIELRSLVVFGHHGYLEEERRLGQRFLVDLWVDVRGSASDTDRIEDTVDYRRLAELRDGEHVHYVRLPQEHDRVAKRLLTCAEVRAEPYVRGSHSRERSTTTAAYSTGGSSTTSGLRTRTRTCSTAEKLSLIHI